MLHSFNSYFVFHAASFCNSSMSTRREHSSKMKWNLPRWIAWYWMTSIFCSEILWVIISHLRNPCLLKPSPLILICWDILDIKLQHIRMNITGHLVLCSFDICRIIINVFFLLFFMGPSFMLYKPAGWIFVLLKVICYRSFFGHTDTLYSKQASSFLHPFYLETAEFTQDSSFPPKSEL